ncbi:MAG: CocE/NonD family hydrolase [Acidimicrobiales bacterium]
MMAGAVLALALVASGCTSDSGSDGAKGSGSGDAPTTLEAHGGTSQIWLRDEPDASYELVDAEGKVVETQLLDPDTGDIELVDERAADDRGALVLRYVDPGEGYVVRRTDGSAQSEPVTVTAFDDAPDQALYDDQEVVEGYQYLTTRDGTKLAANVTLPGPIDEGPYPTVIEYSGYDPANPNASLVTISKQLAAQLGFATVGVNIRGSGCSGGSMQLWEDAQAVDGYDIVETIAAQDWVKDGTVGMVGISYPASAMLYTAATRPPHLSAIAPMAAYDDGFRALLWPGGIQNKGFAKKWIQERYDQAQNPSPADWVNELIDGGDEQCAENLEMRGQNVDLAALIDQMPYFPTQNDLGDRFAPETFVDQIEVPTYLVAAWQDEQVGGHAPTFIPQFDENDQAWFTLTNGYHTEGLAEPSVLQGWLEFLQLFVAKQVPDTTGLTSLYPAVAGQITKDNEGAAKMPIPAENYTGLDYDAALAKWNERPRVRVLFDEGGATSVPPGIPTAAFEHGFDSYPVEGTDATRWYLGPDGTLATEAPTADDDAAGTIDSYTADPSARPEVSLVKDEDSWEALPTYEWALPVAGKALVYTSPALAEDTVMIGSASADLWLRSSEADTDLQVTISEVRPDGQELNVQSGWLRASKRKLDEERSTELQPLISQLEDDAEDLPEGEFVPVRVEVYPFGHAFRAGSKVRVTISAPGGDRPVWSFVQLDGTQDDEIARSAGRPSSIVLPIVPGVEVPTDYPACPSLRGNPCRDAADFTNQTN